MRKVGSTTDTADANGEYTNGNVAQGIPPTIINAEMLNTLQRELIGVVEGAGMALDPTDDNQAFKAIKSFLGSNMMVESNSLGVCLTVKGVLNGVVIRIQAGKAVVNSFSGNINFPKPFDNNVIAVIPSKITDTNRYVSSANHTLIGFDVFGWISGSSGNVDNFSYVAVGW
ncbi:Uncharacterised protein [Serratia proteamaculans]|uniref:hypothetical protein n=1 Tax=Serratia proteamaculans TaxID=28151 RepID=UPI002178F998|nr:hypothetical protein [Serratia proteamaculans]CAI0840786.1 Uncharacterised protein [Serratia proteamaculans]CAI1628389.1 Uncharacterised protein [Serratia proteamaculans]